MAKKDTIKPKPEPKPFEKQDVIGIMVDHYFEQIIKAVEGPQANPYVYETHNR